VEVVQIAQGTIAALCVVGLCGACGPPPGKPKPPTYRLEGSVGQIMDMGYDEVRILTTEDDLALLFVRKHELRTSLPDGGMLDPTSARASEDYPFKIAFALLGSAPPANARVDLAERDPKGNQRGTCTRNVVNDPRTSFPTLLRGTLFLARAPTPGATVRGDFNVTFENGTEPASGRTVFTSFTAKVVSE
jgi:hypothetical protein